MNAIMGLLYQHAARLIAVVTIVVLYGFTKLPQLSVGERAQMAAHFRFTPMPLPELPGATRSVRAVHPSLTHIAAWISSVGAAVALNDLDGDGLPNDVCYVDTRSDQVIITPAPGTPNRYPTFALDPKPLVYDSTMALMGCLPGDLNEDGLMDIVVYYWGRTPLAFLHKSTTQTNGHQLSNDSYVRQALAPGGERWFTNAATFADLDGDGHADLIIGNYFPDGSRILDATASDPVTASDPTTMQHSMSRLQWGTQTLVIVGRGNDRRTAHSAFSNGGRSSRR